MSDRPLGDASDDPSASWTASEIVRAIRSGAVTATAITDAALARIERFDPGIHAFVEVWQNAARVAAAEVDRRRARGEVLGPLAGVPIAIKDNYVRRGFRAGCASKMLEGFVSPYSSTAISRLEAAGAVIVGRTNMDEFGMGSSTERSIHGPTHNPWDLTRTCGGSSGGSAAAVAARFVPIALGSDTGGSVRQPAALCGITGFKPTYGRISRYGLIAFASSLDVVSPFARSIEDQALVLSVLAGVDTNDSTSLDAPYEFETFGAPDRLDGLRIGVPDEYFGAGLDASVAARVREALARFEELGALVVPVSLPHTQHAVATYYLICTAEASSNLARYDGVRYGHRAEGRLDLETMYARSRAEGFGSEVKLRILLGTYGLSSGYYEEYYAKASKVRTLVRADFERAFEDCDVLVTPTSPFAAFELGSKLTDPIAMYLSDVLTVAPSLAGLPTLSLPCGFTDGGLPIGMQCIGPALEDGLVLRCAAAFERATAHHLATPELQEVSR